MIKWNRPLFSFFCLASPPPFFSFQPSLYNNNSLFTTNTDSGPSLDLDELTSQLAAQGLHTPLILRFPDILGDRISKLNGAFAAAIRRCGYPSSYRGVFPVKCNHDCDVIRAVVECGQSYGFGLEVGSKAELVMAAAVLAQSGSAAVGTLLVCNGYKDLEYMELAMHVGQLGPSVVIVMEQPEEVSVALRAAALVPTSPTALGIRAKLGTVHGGHWASTSGDAAKFGLSTREIVDAVRRLETHGHLSRLALLHFHVGSQMSSLGEVRDALAEGAALYAELVNMGAVGLRLLDVGGGLAIDYDGSGSEQHTSRAYALEDYAAAVVGAVGEACAARRVVPPTIVSESGRALASHHAVVIFDVMRDENDNDEQLDTVTPPAPPVLVSQLSLLNSPLQRCSLGEQKQQQQQQQQQQTTTTTSTTTTTTTIPLSPSMKASFLLGTLRQVLDIMGPTATSLRSALSDAAYFKDDTLRAFKMGAVTLMEKALVDTLVDAIAARARELAALHSVTLSGCAGGAAPVRQVHINLSVFRSVVDCWAIGQVFPIVPLSKMDQKPDVEATLADLTCDSDGKIDAFINPKGGQPLSSLPLHSNSTNFSSEPYRLGLFLAGVYQETMGSAHNMFGSLNSATIRLRSRSSSSNAVNVADGVTTITTTVPPTIDATDGGIPSVPSSMSLCSEIHSSSTSNGSECSSSSTMHQHQQMMMMMPGGSLAEWDAPTEDAIPSPPPPSCEDTTKSTTTKSQQHISFVVEGVVAGESVATVLSRAGHAEHEMMRSISTMAAQAVSAGRIDAGDAAAVMQCVTRRMKGYTYMRSSA